MKISSALMEAVSKWASTDPTLDHVRMVAFMDHQIVATDGHRLVSVREHQAPGKTGGFGIYASHIQAAIAAQRCLLVKGPRTLEIVADKTTVHIVINNKDATLTVPQAPIHTFPPYKQVFPAVGISDNGLAGIFLNPEYIAAIGEVSAAQDGKDGRRCFVQVAGWSNHPRDPVLFTNDAGTQFVVMPIQAARR